MDKNVLTIIIIALIAAVVWIGETVYSSSTYVEINPNAGTYVLPISPNFDSITLSKVEERIQDNLPIGTDTYKNLKMPDSSAVTDQSQTNSDTTDNTAGN